MVESLADAMRAGWRLIARCNFGRRDGLRQIRECRCASELDLPTLIWTRGGTFPVDGLEQRLKCPECGSRTIRVVREYPSRVRKE